MREAMTEDAVRGMVHKQQLTSEKTKDVNEAGMSPQLFEAHDVACTQSRTF